MRDFLRQIPCFVGNFLLQEFLIFLEDGNLHDFFGDNFTKGVAIWGWN
jgi:hypothetical protein